MHTEMNATNCTRLTGFAGTLWVNEEADDGDVQA